jgi:hypothetical protein
VKNLSFALLFAVAAMTWVSGTTLVSEESAEKVAGKAAGSWLALVDSGKYSDSWSEAAQLFKERITLQEWESALQSVRTPLGKVDSRKLKSTRYTETLPGAPDGEYVVIQYETHFEKKRSALETITPMKDKNGQWRVSGYYIK